MGIELETLAASAIEGEVVLRGQVVKVRPLSVAEEEAISRQLPEPQLRCPADQRETMRADPAYQRQISIWRERRRSLYYAAAAGLELGGAAWSATMDEPGAAKLADAVRETLSSAEMLRIDRVIGEIDPSDPKTARERIGDETRPGN